VFEAVSADKDTALSGGSSLVWWIVGAGVVASAAYWYNMHKKTRFYSNKSLKEGKNVSNS